MRAVIGIFFLTLFSLSVQAQEPGNPPSPQANPQQGPTEIVNYAQQPTDEPTEPLSEEMCIKAMEDCPEEIADRCKKGLEEKGCVFKPGQTFKHKEKVHMLSEAECIQAVESCPFFEVCRSSLEKRGCMLTPKDLNLPEPTLQEIANFYQERMTQKGPNQFKPTPESCASLKKICAERAGAPNNPVCLKLATDVGC